MKSILIISIAINFLLGSIILMAAYRYREELTQILIGKTNKASLVMFGDSHTKFGKWNSLIKKHRVLRIGSGGHTSDQLSGSITRTIGYGASYVFIQGGGNDIGGKDFKIDNVINNLKLMADFVRDNGMTPVLQNLFYHVDDPEFNAIVDSINSRLEDLCREESIDLIKISDGMNDANGMKQSLASDHAHLNSLGYKKWGEKVNKYLRSKASKK